MIAKLHRRAFLTTAGAGLAWNLRSVTPAFAAGRTIGIVYVGARDDFGWNQAHAVAVQALKTLPGIRMLEEERISETDACAQTMESMINLDGATLILATSYGHYKPFMVDLAKKYPNVEFRHCATLWDKDKDPINAGSYFCYLNQGHYINGVAAGLSTTTNRLGFVAAKPISSVLSNINAFLLGARSVNPNAVVQVIFTGDWSLPVREAESANALADAGCDVVACHVDSPKVIVSTAETRGLKTCGHNSNQAPLAPRGFITGAEYKWETIYKSYAAELARSERLPNFVAGGIADDMVTNTPFGAGATPAAIAAANAATRALRADKPIFVGPLKDNKGNVVIGRTYANSDPFLDRMDYLLEGIIGSTT